MDFSTADEHVQLRQAVAAIAAQFGNVATPQPRRALFKSKT